MPTSCPPPLGARLGNCLPQRSIDAGAAPPESQLRPQLAEQFIIRAKQGVRHYTFGQSYHLVHWILLDWQARTHIGSGPPVRLRRSWCILRRQYPVIPSGPGVFGVGQFHRPAPRLRGKVRLPLRVPKPVGGSGPVKAPAQALQHMLPQMVPFPRGGGGMVCGPVGFNGHHHPPGCFGWPQAEFSR